MYNNAIFNTIEFLQDIYKINHSITELFGHMYHNNYVYNVTTVILMTIAAIA